MKVEMVMPQMGESIAEGTVVRWTKQIGDMVAKDENILDISTDKVDSEILPRPPESSWRFAPKRGDRFRSARSSP